jgi:hypothetical protein
MNELERIMEDAEWILALLPKDNPRYHDIRRAVERIIRRAQQAEDNFADMLTELDAIRRENAGILPYLPDDFD